MALSSVFPEYHRLFVYASSKSTLKTRQNGLTTTKSSLLLPTYFNQLFSFFFLSKRVLNCQFGQPRTRFFLSVLFFCSIVCIFGMFDEIATHLCFIHFTVGGKLTLEIFQLSEWFILLENIFPNSMNHSAPGKISEVKRFYALNHLYLWS